MLKAENDHIQRLAKSFRESNSEGSFSRRSFFKSWFATGPNGYFFLFKKNLRVTNLQYAELFALVSSCATSNLFPQPSPRPMSVQFMSEREYVELVSSLFSDFASAEGKNRWTRAAERCYEVLSRTVVVDAFFGSCTINLPPNLDLDLADVCARSGYIHSCGRIIFARNILKATADELYEDLGAYIDGAQLDGKRALFAVYAHEDFSRFDRELANEMRNGLDDIKVYVEKYYMGDQSLVAVVQEIRSRFGDSLVVAGPRNSRRAHKSLRESTRDLDPSRTIWLIQDHSISGSQERGERSLLCYDQLYKNANPFHIFDENKPGWIDHTTIPHTMLGAMINLTTPNWPSMDAVVVDPFVGSGTTWLETLKFDGVNSCCSDNQPVCHQVALDNLRFFSMTANELSVIHRQLRLLVAKLLKNRDFLEAQNEMAEDAALEEATLTDLEDAALTDLPEEAPGSQDDLRREWDEVHNSYTDALDFVLTQQVDGEGRIRWSPPVAAKFGSLNEMTRYLIYLAQKTALRNSVAFLRTDEIAWKPAFCAEVAVFRHQLRSLVSLRRNEEGDVVRLDVSKTILPGNIGTYSSVCTTSSIYLAGKAKNVSKVEVVDIEECNSLPSADIIVADPPYGFNTKENPFDLAQLYDAALRKMVSALADQSGQLVLALPDVSLSGKASPSFTHKEFIVRQLSAISEELGVDMILPTLTILVSPEPRSAFGPPYYWESERALRRAILHFQFRRKDR